MNKYPNEKECMIMLKDYGTPANVIGHCKAVAGVAVTVGNKLNEKGFNLNIDLTRAAGLTHDIARVEDKHWLVGENLLREKGYPEVADIIAVHMYYPSFSLAVETTETDLVCLGDRTVKFDKFVGVDERMEYIKNKVRNNAKEHVDEVLEKVNLKEQQLKKYIKDIEEIMEMSLEDLMKGH